MRTAVLLAAALSVWGAGCVRRGAANGDEEEIRGVPVGSQPPDAAVARGAGGGGGGVSGGASLPRRGAPANYSSNEGPGGAGRILRASFSGNARSARMVMTALLGDLGAQYFDGKPGVTGAVASQDDQRGQAMFQTALGAVPVAGLLVVELSEGSGRATVLLDTSARFRSSLPELARLAGGAPGGVQPAPKRQIQWVQHQFPDGSGAIQLPSDWRLLSAAKGAVDAMGPNGEAIGLGGPFLVNTNQWYAQSGYLVGPYMKPLQALEYLYPQMARQTARLGYHKQLERIIESQEFSEQGVPAAYTLYDGVLNGRAYRWYEMSTTRMIDQSMWMYYQSVVGAPRENFAGEFGTLLQVWGSWQISGRLIASRLRSAVESMRQAGEIYRSANQSASATYDRTNRAWSLYIRGNELVEHMPTGGRGEVDQNYARKMVEELNRAEGAETWRVVPMRDY